MDLPASVTALGEQLRGAGEIVPDPALLQSADVFAAERQHMFLRPKIAIDHETRLSEDGHFFRCETGPRSILVTRESGGRFRALRNVCIHAGYPVCDAEEGPAERLICPYHGWEYALDGRLVEPELSSRIDPARLRLTEYPVHLRNGLIFVDLSGKSSPGEQSPVSVPAWLPGATVTRRARYSTTCNWKFVHNIVRLEPDLFFDDPLEPDDRQSCLEFGPLSAMIARSRSAVLLRVVPRFAEQTELHLIEMVAGDAPQNTGPATGPDRVADRLRPAETPTDWFDRRFADWYWSLMSAAA
jgi:nitrite reductase/ring-hydroxylating ferredoxin subunit